ncbi:M20/M25/M40 family metallo-hydrolase [Lacticaseibacillus parakribbianus]|uniref:M20/M25/M40 family metallo-hydrolase n=1 Tax=Lacticaseibacillus parakribbianus TaxID=2970927 RepID=UPI0021CB1D78|nr:M20/M25/M40 family metallo-hydrolase [Lacticaseibacillus parakribbianus]
MIDWTALDAAVTRRLPEFAADLAALIAVPSSAGEPAPHAPFGQAPRRVLDVACELATAAGFSARVVADAAAEVTWGPTVAAPAAQAPAAAAGDPGAAGAAPATPAGLAAGTSGGTEPPATVAAPATDGGIGLFGHLDVVAAGADWHSDPFVLTERAGRYYGRGVLDNKGPAWACFFAMRLLKDAGFTPRRRVRLVLGSDEESGSRDMPRYLAAAGAPAFGWTPDCKFPVVYGERGIVNYRIDTPIVDGSLAALTALSGDTDRGHVPAVMRATVAGQLLEAHGHRSPSNAPELGDNALTKLAQAVAPVAAGQLAAYCGWLGGLHGKHHGEGLGIVFHDVASGSLIQTPYNLTLTATGLALELAVRYPVSVTESQVTAGLAAAVPTGSRVTVTRSLPGTRHDPLDPRIQALSAAYAAVTGSTAAPVTTTGATYARAVPNIVAFGPSFPGQKGIAHKEDEWLAKADLIACVRIYARALAAVSG